MESGRLTDKVISALIEAADRGVDIALLLDAVGSRRLQRRDRKRIRAAGIQLTLYNPLKRAHMKHFILRDHRKLFSIDNHIGFIGGFGLSDHFLQDQHQWHDVAVQLRGEIAKEMADVVYNTVYATEHETVHETVHERVHEARKRSPKQHTPLSAALSDRNITSAPLTSTPPQLLLNEGAGKQRIKQEVLNRITHAENRIWLVTAYFYPSMKLRRALKRAAHQGVDVKLLLPGRDVDHWSLWWAGRFYYKRLLRHGVQIYEYQTAFMHSKFLICDQWITLGSSNFDRWGQRWNLEANIGVENSTLLTELSAQMQTDLSNSLNVTYTDWTQRSLLRRTLEHWGHHTMLMLERILKTLFLRFRR